MTGPDTPSPSPSGDHLPVPREDARVVHAATWDDAFSRAEERTRQELGPRAFRRADRPSNWAVWGRVAVPVLILLAYGGYKYNEWRVAQLPPADQVVSVGALAGVEPRSDAARLNEETRAFIAELQAHLESRRWEAIRTAVTQAPPGLGGHPVVRAYDLIALVESGGNDEELIDRIAGLERDLERAGEKGYTPLLDYLRLMRGTVLLRNTASVTDLIARSSDFRQILLSQSAGRVTDREIEFRHRLAQRYLTAGELVEAEGTEFFGSDKQLMARARSLYREAVRWLTTAETYPTARPVRPGTAGALLDDALFRLRRANREFHGPDLPFSNKDNETWTGIKGDPVHDQPPPQGAW